ncbi:glycosyltransferase [Nocardia terpenica]|uniref:Glycosyl transferase n=1 Tax=Nocardia terpenica TaxID=455432 RepID=A0A164M935_9NOCA|nr:glycosyltransferase [Nocardia terpenica]KZM73154.1 glycosyl transferase [Nocardia terpenica]MBF6064265.1 glycosyltransferase [Nocardia terpenica]MBF6106598.1 glycosyltransferase [Nocardia terpenica]MBF6113883.1 glycosyltransferase [Nocardia terpenica]MBF6120493.1 glycosyltransferase [Nocardia terpenica]
MNSPLSICVPAYNAARTLETTLRSILDQDTDFELIVLDNASTDDTGAIAAAVDDPRIRLHRNDRVLPIGENWNRAVALTSGALVKVVCADDILLPGAVKSQFDVMWDAGIAISSGKFDVIDEAGAVEDADLGLPGLLGMRSARTLMQVIVRRGPADFGPTAAAMFRRTDFDRVGGFRGDLVFPMDVDLFARVCEFGVFYGMPEVLAAWRNSSFNLCSHTSTVSKLTELARFHHRLRREYRELVTPADVLTGDLRLAGQAWERLRIRAVATVRHRPDLLR